MEDYPYGRRVYLPLAEDRRPEDAFGEPDFPEYDWPDQGHLVAVAQVRYGEDTTPTPCDAGALPLRKGDAVVLEGDARGPALAVVTSPPRRVYLRERPWARVSRRANELDLKTETKLRLREAEAVKVASATVRAMDLPVKVVRAECAMNQSRLVVHLASDERPELRDLGRQLSVALRTRVELRHVGVRDAARSLGGVGPCGLQLCCNTFLSEFAPVSIRQAKDQGLALNPQRVSGVCGRLMCCLVYEDAFYRQQRALFPKQNKRVNTPKGEGRVRDVDVLARTVRVSFPDGTSESFSVDDVKAVFPPQAQGRPSPAQGPDPEDAPEE
ncbi:MAG: stage 0 sporulation protein [Deltaproteobacteria bacterium]|nr:stage 0 sporulation protein [Deltaproteobacteria bacterium]